MRCGFDVSWAWMAPPGFSFILYIQYSGLAVTHGTGLCCWLAMGCVCLGLDKIFTGTRTDGRNQLSLR
jgi:hypothetical protein